MAEHSLTRSNRTAALEHDGHSTAKTYRISVLSGDGIGPEVMEVALQVLDFVAHKVTGLNLQFTEHQAGAEHFRRTGVVLPKSVLDDCRAADAVFLSAIGLPDVRLADGTEVQPEMMIGLRRALGFTLPSGLSSSIPAYSPLANVRGGIDFVISARTWKGCSRRSAAAPRRRSTRHRHARRHPRRHRKAVEYAFRLADRRRGRPMDGSKLVTCVDKANVFRSFAFFRKVFFDVAAEHPHIAAEAAYVDAVSLYMVQDPRLRRDGDGEPVRRHPVRPWCRAGRRAGPGPLGRGRRCTMRLFQPSHGTAPQLAGKNVANPFAMVLSAAMMLDWLAERNRDSRAAEAAKLIETGVEKMLLDGKTRTPDMGGVATRRMSENGSSNRSAVWRLSRIAALRLLPIGLIIKSECGSHVLCRSFVAISR